MRSIKELRDMRTQELEAAHEELCQRLFALRNAKIGIGDLPKSSDVQHGRKEIARVLTVLRERELQEGKTVRKGHGRQ